MNPVYGFSNHLAAHQPPKDCRFGVVGEAVHNDKTQRSAWDLEHGSYKPYASLRDPGVIDGGGEIDSREAWRCPDCGAELQDVMSASCAKCGSVEPAEYR